MPWPRVFPNGDGSPNPKGLDFYNHLVDELLANNIQPFATLYHWDLPQSLQERGGGWESRDTSKAFGDYAGYVAERLSDRVKHFFTINEFGAFVELGYRVGIHAPGLKLPSGRFNQTRHHAVLGHVEENALGEEFGFDYANYVRETNTLIPGIY